MSEAPLLEIAELKKSYVAPDGARTPIIDVAQFALAAGRQVAMEGASGSGKTTLLHLIAGILQPDSGRIAIAGEEMTALGEAGRDRLRARRIGYVFQTFNLLQGYTALENVLLGQMFGAGVDEARARELLARVGLASRLSYRPRQLSVGQQQRVALARALVTKPLVLLADEPTGNLDSANSASVLELITALVKENGTTLVMATHSLEAAKICRRIVRLKDGKIESDQSN